MERVTRNTQHGVSDAQVVQGAAQIMSHIQPAGTAKPMYQAQNQQNNQTAAQPVQQSNNQVPDNSTMEQPKNQTIEQLNHF